MFLGSIIYVYRKTTAAKRQIAKRQIVSPPCRVLSGLSQRSGAARTLATGVTLAAEEPPGVVGPLLKMKTSRFWPTILSEYRFVLFSK